MHSNYIQKDYVNLLTTIPASTTAQVVSNVIPLTAESAMAVRVDVTYSTAVVAASIKAILQQSPDGGVSWAAVSGKEVALTAAAGVYTVKSILFNGYVTTDSALAPLCNLVRVVVTTGIGDSIAITGVLVTQAS
jgi:hypothetical protein